MDSPTNLKKIYLIRNLILFMSTNLFFHYVLHLHLAELKVYLSIIFLADNTTIKDSFVILKTCFVFVNGHKAAIVMMLFPSSTMLWNFKIRKCVSLQLLMYKLTVIILIIFISLFQEHRKLFFVHMWRIVHIFFYFYINLFMHSDFLSFSSENNETLNHF